MHRVVVLALDGVYPFELGIAHRVFGTLATEYDVQTCSVDGKPVRTNADFTIEVPHGAELLSTADTVILPPCIQGPETLEPAALAGQAALLDRIRPGARIVSICTGAFLLAAAGRLDGRPATTHWALADRFRALFPRVHLDPDVLFVDDGDILTSAGAASGVDVCLHLVRTDHGSAVANEVARVCVVPPWREGGQAQYIRHPVPTPAATGTATARQWALERLHLPLSLAQLAAQARMSLRTFNRRFREEVGASPGQWLTQQRLRHARELLESTDLPVDEVAARVGFATATSLRHHLHTAIGVAPLQYRRTFRTGGPPHPHTRTAS